MIRRRNALAIICCAALLAAPSAYAAQVALDGSFSGDGKTLIDLTENSSVTSLEKFGGQIYAAGIDRPTDSRNIFVTRYGLNGSIDADFNIDGVVHLAPDDDRWFGAGLDVNAAGDAAVVGQGPSVLVVARLNASGFRDDSFSGDGVRRLNVNGTSRAFDPDIAFDTQGRLIVATTVVKRDGYDVSIFRLLPNGDRDESFGSHGVRTFDFGERDWMDAMAVDDRNRVVLGTDTESERTPNAPATLIRLRQNGSYDPNFSDNGIMRVRLLPRRVAVPVAIGVRVNGVVTAALTTGADAYGVARVREDGELKRSYGDNGVLGLTCDCRVLESDIVNGRVVMTGERTDGTTLLTRIAPDGFSLSQGWIDLYPAIRNEVVEAVTFDGSKSIVGGRAFKTAYLARIR